MSSSRHTEGQKVGALKQLHAGGVQRVCNHPERRHDDNCSCYLGRDCCDHIAHLANLDRVETRQATCKGIRDAGSLAGPLSASRATCKSWEAAASVVWLGL